MSLPSGRQENETRARETGSIADLGTLANSPPQESVKGRFLSWQIAAEPAKPRNEDDADQRDPGLLFINTNGPTALHPRERKQVRSHEMQRYVRKRSEKIIEENRRRKQGKLQLQSSVDQVSGAGGVDPFNALPVTMSRSNSRLLQYFAQHIAPLHYPPSRGVAEHNPMTTTWIATAMSDTALLHSTLSSSSGHMLHYANLPPMSSVYLSGYLYHKTETIRIINERMKENSKVIADETLGAIALLITGQTCQGDYNEMNVHMRGLAQLVCMRGGLEALGMSGLLAGEILWCDNVTAFVSSAKPLLAMPEISNRPFESFEDEELNLCLTRAQARQRRSSFTLWSPALKQILPDGLITALHNLHTMTAFLDTSPSLSKHDMLVYDRKRASIQHQLAGVAVPPIALDTYHITESCRLATMIYSIFALWGFKPPMSLYGDLAKMLQKGLQTTDDVCHWGAWSEMLLWTLFIGGYAAVGRPERIWFSTMIRKVLKGQNLNSWRSTRDVLETMPVCQALWSPFETLWWEVTAIVLEGEAVRGGVRILAM